MPDDKIYLNGIDGRTGRYLVPAKTAAELAAIARGAPPRSDEPGWLRRLLRRAGGLVFGLPYGLEPAVLAQAGWGVIFPVGTPAAVLAHLKLLLDHRRGQAGGLYKEFDYRPGETRDAWLARHGASGANVQPEVVPYHLLLVGHPHQIPFEFQYELDVDYAVGRLAFDRDEDYAAYAAAVVAYESGATPAGRREVAYWGTRHESDRATELSADDLIAPLARGEAAVAGQPAALPPAARFGYESRLFLGADATRANLLDVLRSRPSVLFTASHGMGWPKDDPHQTAAQGALLCQDWTGFGGVRPDHYLTAADLAPVGDFRGTIAFVFACFGAGTPRYDNFLTDPARGPVELAARPFVSALAQRLLAGGALAVIGHVERAWGYSIRPPSVGPQLLPFRNLVARLLAGEPAGHATVDFSQRYATASVALTNLLAPHLPGAVAATDESLVWTWVDRNDAQNYVLLGDPAVRLRDGTTPASTAPPPATVAAPNRPVPPVGPPVAAGVAFTPPAGFHDATEYSFAGGGRKVTVTAAGPALAAADLLLPAARAYAQQLTDLFAVPSPEVSPLFRRPDGVAFVTVTARFPDPGPQGRGERVERLALLRLPSGAAVRLTVTAPAADPEAEADFNRLVETASALPGGGAVAFAFSHVAGGPAGRRVGPLVVELPGGCRETTEAVTFRESAGTREVRARLADERPLPPPAFSAGGPQPVGTTVAGPVGSEAPFSYEVVPSPWAAPRPAAAPAAVATPGVPPPPVPAVVERVIGGRRLVFEVHAPDGDGDPAELARQVAATARPADR